MGSWLTRSSTEINDEALKIDEVFKKIDEGVRAEKGALAYLQKNRKYRYIKFLGCGGFGSVYRVYDDKAGKSLAIKCTNETNEMELSWWPKLDHPNILPLYETITVEKVTVFIMPTMQKDLMQVVEDASFYKDDLSFGLSRVWLRDVASALAYLHGQFLCYCDLHLSNVFLKEDGFVCLGDFSYLSDSREFFDLPEPPDHTRWSHYVQKSKSSTTTGGDKYDMWAYGILAVNLLCNQMLFGWSVLEKIILHDEYLSNLLEKTFISVAFKQEDFGLCHDFLKKILCFKPEQRMSAEEAMVHPFAKTEWPQLPTVVDEDGRELLPLPIEEIIDPSMTVEEVIAAAAEEEGEKENLPDTPSKGKKLLEIKPVPSVKRLPRRVMSCPVECSIFNKKPHLEMKDAAVQTMEVEGTYRRSAGKS